MIKVATKNVKKFSLEAIIGKHANKEIIEKDGVITEDIANKRAYVFYKKELDLKTMKGLAEKLTKANRSYQIEINSFVNDELNEDEIVKALVDKNIFVNAKGVFDMRTKKKEKEIEIDLLGVSKNGKKVFDQAKMYAEAVNYARNYQTMPPNELTSVEFAKRLKADFSKYKNLSIKVLTLKEIKAAKMGLLLAVNKGSAHDARLVVIEYKGNASSKEKTAFIGKGIMFDAGGMNIKTGGHMRGMKYDMSGAAISAAAMTVISQLKPKQNVAAVLPLTDNMVSNLAGQPDSIYTAMNGKTVEVNNTDAEGRLVMADALTYAVKKLSATRVVDIATLTGAIVVALGDTYTGAWSTTEKGWEDLSAAAKKAGEYVWRLPLHPDFFDYMKNNKIADMYNTNYSGRGGGSNSAAMFLTKFSEGAEHIHLDIAGTAEIKGLCMGPMVKTLAELVNK